ncbi:hypothetical protein [Mumia zhuanghuii]|uniref:SnoaL-like domain-containing protein n=1 Tax=Mumia zhuanghuii TaxID=2585211 RepID=A0A5C4MP41_9ACTN|nr:hypothetical protein [Mumia zhuanghuii]TNC47371.1 hypothetical protein FHE65_10180 [Mumia zhuanghuii]TNC47650.1 hypothetical protein FHE65_09185 [Mumia zhuanghuii]
MDPVSMWCAAVVAAGAVSQSAVWMDRLAVLDDGRSAAFVRADPSLLDDVYVPGGRLRASDDRLVREYAARGLEIADVRFEVLRFGVEQASEARAVLRVVDRLEPVRVRRPGGAWRTLPRDGPTDRRIVVVRTPVGWRIEAVRRLAG